MNIEPFYESDLSFLRAFQPEGWSDILPSYHFYIHTGFCFPVKLLMNNKMVGIGASIIHKEVAWLAHIIVLEEYRNQGFGNKITQSLVDLCHRKNCTTINLIATDLGEPVYEKVGFETESEYLVFRDVAGLPHIYGQKYESIIPYSKVFKEQIALLDKKVSGEERIYHLELYFNEGFVYYSNNQVEGFYLPMLGDGVILADTVTAGLELMKFRLKNKNYAIFPIDNSSATKLLHDNHFFEYKVVKRMRLGKQRFLQLDNIYNRIGGNLG